MSGAPQGCWATRACDRQRDVIVQKTAGYPVGCRPSDHHSFSLALVLLVEMSCQGRVQIGQHQTPFSDTILEANKTKWLLIHIMHEHERQHELASLWQRSLL